MKARHCYTSEEDAWLKDNIQHFDGYSDLVAAFNIHFDTDVDKTSLGQRCSKFLGIKTGAHHVYTEEEKDWLRDNAKRFERYQEVADEFNRLFNADVGIEAMRTLCNRYLKVGLGKSCTTFKPGARPRSLPIGTVRKSQTGTYIKVSDSNICASGYAEPDWLPLQKKIWQDTYGKLDEGYMVCFLNHDPSDFRLENLYPINRKISSIMSKNGWWNENPELTMTAIKWCELHYAIKAVKVNSTALPIRG